MACIAVTGTMAGWLARLLYTRLSHNAVCLFNQVIVQAH